MDDQKWCVRKERPVPRAGGPQKRPKEKMKKKKRNWGKQGDVE